MCDRFFWLAGAALAAAVWGSASCSFVNEGPETRPLGEPVLSVEQLRESKTALDFERHVKPVLEARCLACHDGKQMPGLYSLATREDAFRAGPTGPRIVPGRADLSLLYISISTGNHALSMPAVGIQVAQEEVDVLRWWIDAGAEWPEGVWLQAQ